MTQTLRPMRLGEILDLAVQLLRSNLALFIAIALLPAIAQFGMSTASDFVKGNGRGAPYAIALLALPVFGLANLIIGPMARAANCWTASRLMLDRHATMREAYGAFSNRKGSLVWLTIVQSLMSFWPVIILYFIVSGAISGVGSKASVVFAVCLAVMAAVPCGLLWARYQLAFPAAAILGTDTSASIKRSVTLGDGYRWKVMWAGVLPGGISLALQGSGDWFFELLKGWHYFGRHSDFFAPFLDNFWNLLVGLVFLPLQSIAITLVYYDLCVRKEGLDVTLLMEQAGMATFEQPATLASAGEESV
jgi:hypothetical protein